MNLEQIRLKLQDRRTSSVAKATGIHPNTIRFIRNGKSQNPSFKVVAKLVEYLSGGVANG
jgi:transcriptional regulator with XRE-family HTH domain